MPAGVYIGIPVDESGDETRNYGSVEGLEWGWFVDKAGQAYIHKALIGDGVLSTSFNVKLNVADKGKQHEADMALDVENGKGRIKFLAEKFAIASNTQNALEAALQQTIKKVVNEAIQQAMQPGGTIWTSLKRGF